MPAPPPRSACCSSNAASSWLASIPSSRVPLARHAPPGPHDGSRPYGRGHDLQTHETQTQQHRGQPPAEQQLDVPLVPIEWPAVLIRSQEVPFKLRGSATASRHARPAQLPPSVVVRCMMLAPKSARHAPALVAGPEQ